MKLDASLKPADLSKSLPRVFELAAKKVRAIDKAWDAARGTLLSDGTYGWSGAQGTHFFVDPKEQLVGVLMIQTPNVREIRGDFENLVAQAIID